MERIKRLYAWGRENPLKARAAVLACLWLLIFAVIGAVKVTHWGQRWSLLGPDSSALGSSSGNN